MYGRAAQKQFGDDYDRNKTELNENVLFNTSYDYIKS